MKTDDQSGGPEHFVSSSVVAIARALDAGDVNLAARVVRTSFRFAWLRATLPARLLFIRLWFGLLSVVCRLKYRVRMLRSEVRFQFRMLALRWR